MATELKEKILLLKTSRGWCLEAFIREQQAVLTRARVFLLTNSDAGDHEFEKIFNYTPRQQLSADAVSPEIRERLSKEDFDRVIVLTTVKIPSLYQHVYEFVDRLGYQDRMEVYFRHAPDGSYDDRFKAGFWLQDEIGNDWYVKALFDKAGFKPENQPLILDLACGRGIWANHMYNSGYRNVIGVDLSLVGIKDAQRLNPRIRWCLGNMFNLPFPENVFDCIFLNGFGMQGINMQPLIGFGKQRLSLLKPGGCLIQAQPSIDMSGDPKGDPIEVRYLSREILAGYFEQVGFSRVESYLTDRSELKTLGAQALTEQNTAVNSADALTDIRFRVTVTFCVKPVGGFNPGDGGSRRSDRWGPP